MANIKRDRWEMLRQRVYPTTGANVIEVGDHLVRDSNGYAQPVSSLTDTTGSSAGNRQENVRKAIVKDYIGMAMSAKLTGATPNVRVAVDVVAEYSVPSALGSAMALGLFVRPQVSDNGTTATGVNQQVEVSAGSSEAIGKLAKNAANAATLVTCHLMGVSVQPVLSEQKRIMSVVSQHLELQTQDDNKNVRINSRDYKATSGGVSGMQCKPNQIVTTTGDLTGGEFSPRFNDCDGGGLVAVKADPVIKDASSARTVASVVGVEVNVDMPNAGSAVTITNDVNAFSTFLDTGSGHTISGKKSVLKVRTPNVAGWDYLFDIEASAGVMRGAGASNAVDSIKIQVAGATRYILVYDT